MEKSFFLTNKGELYSILQDTKKKIVVDEQLRWLGEENTLNGVTRQKSFSELLSYEKQVWTHFLTKCQTK